jgi:hypothetical protein
MEILVLCSIRAALHSQDALRHTLRRPTMDQSSLAAMIFVGALVGIALKRSPRQILAAQRWVFPTPYGSEVGVRAFGRTDSEIIEHLWQTV